MLWSRVGFAHNSYRTRLENFRGQSIGLHLNFVRLLRERGGGQSQVNQLRSDYQTLKVCELANLAAEGDEDAETAIKILKQAKKKRDKYGKR